MIRSYEPTDCPACGGSDAGTLAHRHDVLREMERLWDFHLRRMRPGVPVRELTDRVVFSQDPPLRLARCAACGTVHRDPRDNARSVTERYRDSEQAGDVLDRLMEAQLPTERGRVRRLNRIAGRPGRGVEVGCYTGAFLAAANRSGWRFQGLDVNDDVLAHVRRKGLTARRGTATTLRPDDRWDAVVFWTCFDQLPDPRPSLAAAAASLRPDGILALRVPNGAFYARVRRRLGGPLSGVAERLLGWNNLLGFPYLQGYALGSLRGLLGDAGLRVVKEVGDVLVPLSGGWTRSWAAAEERAVKRILRAAPPAASPWIEVYARRIRR